MFRKVLVAIDGSEPANRALQEALDDAVGRDTDVHAVYVVESGLFSSLPMDNTLEIIYSVLQKEGEDILKSARKKADEVGVSLTTHLRQGHAGSQIISLAEELGADRIFLGSYGKSGVDRLLLGSVTEYVVRNSPITTTVVRS
ncbi:MULTISPECIES: universal stress protein [Methanoculleus]|jgi:nucleotide-binding universal stress UspA family protein|uniref:Nucleotide-binding universal stress protein, UspA family n=1 Tax=Methanoculleus thermophilus TaxID=2200 RepID=A0A1G8YRW0_9EURY|nr:MULTISPECIES: universal stress protein [Methanoculleus]NLN08806.1 universal stress protein [Methanoculleus thermophilus]SDK05164.1 Nucleotide-binding universal stress protein, UspA family [Methanoculleus thermophilus]HQD25271.1 universal stress protein [Methanoculleus thermophilus]